MSYIRSGSNPEKLYVFWSTGGKVEFYPGADYPPFRHMPPKVFETLGHAYWQAVIEQSPGDDGFEYEGGWLKWVTVPNTTEEHIEVDWKIQIGYKDGDYEWSLDLWEVTCREMFDRFREELRYQQTGMKKLSYMIRLLKVKLLT